MSTTLALKSNSLVIDSDLELHDATEEDSLFLKKLYNDPEIQSLALGEESIEILMNMSKRL